MEQIKWVDRKFLFGYSKGYIPFFIERLRSTAPRLEEMLNGIDNLHASSKINNEWSIKEHIGHLCDLESLHNGRIDDFVTGVEVLRAADMSNKETYSADHNERSIPHLLAHFREVRGRFIKKVEALDEVYLDRKALHPRLQQKASVADILFFVAEHDTHHLTKIVRLI